VDLPVHRLAGHVAALPRFPASKKLTEDLFAEGIGFERLPRIRGFQAINEERTVLLFPDPASAFRRSVSRSTDACRSRCGTVAEPGERACRYSARIRAYVGRRKRRQYLTKTGIATDGSYYGPEAEFLTSSISVRFRPETRTRATTTTSTPRKGILETRGRTAVPNLGATGRGHKEGYFPVPPVDRLQDLALEDHAWR